VLQQLRGGGALGGVLLQAARHHVPHVLAGPVWGGCEGVAVSRGRAVLVLCEAGRRPGGGRVWPPLRAAATAAAAAATWAPPPLRCRRLPNAAGPCRPSPHLAEVPPPALVLQAGGRVLQRHEQHLHGRELGERRVPVGHLQHGDAQGPDVRG
jgi:hypothetical protein